MKRKLTSNLRLTIDPARFEEIRTSFARILREADHEKQAKKAESAKGSKTLSEIVNTTTDVDLRQSLLNSLDKYGPNNTYSTYI